MFNCVYERAGKAILLNKATSKFIIYAQRRVEKRNFVSLIMKTSSTKIIQHASISFGEIVSQNTNLAIFILK